MAGALAAILLDASVGVGAVAQETHATPTAEARKPTRLSTRGLYRERYDIIAAEVAA
jgi:hypothetical protein